MPSSDSSEDERDAVEANNTNKREDFILVCLCPSGLLSD